MKSLNDLIWTNEDDDIITTQSVMTKPCKISDDCAGGDGGWGIGLACVLPDLKASVCDPF